MNFMISHQDGPADNCKNYTTQKLDESIQKMIVGFHNSLRNKVASGEEIRGKPGPQLPASNMFILVRIILTSITLKLCNVKIITKVIIEMERRISNNCSKMG